jgi:membrane protease YdiL (CAAX protease family)
MTDRNPVLREDISDTGVPPCMATETATELPGTGPQATAVPTTRSRAVLTGAVLSAVALVGTIPILVGVEHLQAALGYGGELAVTYLVSGSVHAAFMGLVALLYLRFRPVTIPVRWPTLRELALVAGTTVFALVLAVLVQSLGAALGAEPVSHFVSRAAAQDPVLVYGGGLVMVLLLVGPVEELLFRGVVQGRLRESFGPVGAIGLTSVLFGLGHYLAFVFGGTELVSLGLGFALFGTAVTSVVLGTVYEHTGNLAIPALIHSLFNGTLFAIALLSVL